MNAYILINKTKIHEKRILLSIVIPLLSLHGFTQVTKQQATLSVLSSVVGNDVDDVNVYMEPYLKSDSYYKMSRYDSIHSPYNSYWLYFIDDMPEYGWGHDCRYVFVNSSNGALSVVNNQTPPLHFKLHLDVVSEPISFTVPTNNTATGNPNPLNPNYPSNDGKFAVLFTGGETNGDSLKVFWNALSHSYCGLVENGFKKENIFVLSCDGRVGNPASNETLDLDGDGHDDILKDTCNLKGIRMVFDSLSRIVNEGDILYVFGTTHGFQDVNDGNRYYLHLWEGERLYDTTFSNMLLGVDCSQYIVNLFSCHSGAILNGFIIQPCNAKKTVLTCIGNASFVRNIAFSMRAGMDKYNYFICSALRNCHPYKSDTVWLQGSLIGQLQDATLFGYTNISPPDVNYDSIIHGGNGDGIHEIGEAINYTSHFDPLQFGQNGIKHYECGFDTIDDLLSLRGVTGTVNASQTIRGSFHIEDTLSIQADSLTLAAMASLYLFDADLVVQEGSILRMRDKTSIIARNGDCRVVILGSLETGSGITFEARDGATLEVVFQNDTVVDICDASFVDCTLTLPNKSIVFNNCEFRGTALSAQKNSVPNSGNDTVSIVGCTFIPHGRNMGDAIYVKGYSRFKIRHCVIGDSSDEGSYVNGISLQNCGNAIQRSDVSNNEISYCTGAGLQLYGSTGNVKNNKIHDNQFGVKLLNNSNVGEFTGTCSAVMESRTQYIHDNEKNEVYMTRSCIPELFRYNAIADDDNIPFLYHDATSDAGIENDSTQRASIDVTYNYWGTNFVPATHLYTNQSDGYQYNPQWPLGICYGSGNGNHRLAQADSLASLGEYEQAKSLYKEVVERCSTTNSAATALKSLLNLERQNRVDFASLREYYLADEVISSDERLSRLASSLANKCDEEMGRYENAIEWYENVLEDPETPFNDSVFAAIDLGDLYLGLEQAGEKKEYGKLRMYVPESSQEHQKQTEYALSLLPVEKEVVKEKSVKEYLPVTNLETSVYENDTVFLTWVFPEGYDSDITLSWSSMLWMENYFGCACGQCATDQAAQFDAEDLKSLIGWRIKNVSVILSFTDTLNTFVDKQYFIRIWNSDDAYSSFIYEKKIEQPAYSIPLTITVDSSIVIEEGKGVRIGWYLDTYTLYPWEMDGLPVAPNGKGFYNRMYHDSQTGICEADQSWDNYWPFATGNLNVSATLSHPDKKTGGSNSKGQLSGYRVYRDGELVKEIPYSFVTYFKDVEYARGVDVEYCVTALYGNEESDPVCVTATITGVAETVGNEKIAILPNPTTGLVRIEGETVADAMVYNTMGQRVLSAHHTNEINLKDLPPGIYILHVTTMSGSVLTKKVVKE